MDIHPNSIKRNRKITRCKPEGVGNTRILTDYTQNPPRALPTTISISFLLLKIQQNTHGPPTNSLIYSAPFSTTCPFAFIVGTSTKKKHMTPSPSSTCASCPQTRCIKHAYIHPNEPSLYPKLIPWWALSRGIPYPIGYYGKLNRKHHDSGLPFSLPLYIPSCN